MVIYGEYLFLENFLTGLVITYFTGRIAGLAVGRLRLLLCGLLCGAFAFSMFAAMPGAVTGAAKLLFAFGAAAAAFGWKGLRQTALLAGLFMIVTVFYGGTTVALLSFFGWQGIADGAGVYLPGATYLTVSAAAVCGLLILRLAVDLIRTKRQAGRTVTEVSVSMGGRRWQLTGFIDSGNLLREPLTGRPVALVGKALMEEMLAGAADADVRYAAVPYRAVGTERGLLDGWRADYIELENGQVKRPVLAVWGDGRFLPGEKGGQILLPAEMLERGIYAEAE